MKLSILNELKINKYTALLCLIALSPNVILMVKDLSCGRCQGSGHSVAH